jgi:hypothetical protein
MKHLLIFSFFLLCDKNCPKQAGLINITSLLLNSLYYKEICIITNIPLGLGLLVFPSSHNQQNGGSGKKVQYLSGEVLVTVLRLILFSYYSKTKQCIQQNISSSSFNYEQI